MAEPRIQYAQTIDEVSIAYYAIGSGPVLIHATLPHTNIRFEWQLPEVRRNIQAASGFCTYVRYDPRGFGMSAEPTADFSLDAFCRDLEAVADRVSPGSFALMGMFFAAPLAAAYAARNPARISKLVLWQGAVRGADIIDRKLVSLLEASEDDWELASEAMWHALQGWDEDTAARRSAAFMREAARPRVILDFFRQAFTWDVGNELSRIGAPTLVIGEPERYPDPGVSAQMAKLIPKSELILLKGSQDERHTAGLAAVGQFLFARAPRTSERRREPGPSQISMTAILFADIADSTALTEQIGDSAFREKARDLDTSLRGIIIENAGTPIEGKLLGDGVLATFGSATEAIRAALGCGKAGDNAGLALHVGIHAGDVIREENNVYGGAVNIVARIATESAPGEVLASQTVRDLARTSAGVSFEDRGRKTLKGVEGRQRLFAVREVSED